MVKLIASEDQMANMSTEGRHITFMMHTIELETRPSTGL